MKEGRDSQRAAFHIFQNTETTLRQEEQLNIFFGLEGVSEISVESSRYLVGKGGILVVNPWKLYRVDALKSSVIVLQVPPRIRKAAGAGWQGSIMHSYNCYVKDDEGAQPEYQALRAGYASVFYEYLQNRHAVSGSYDTALIHFLNLLAERFGSVHETAKGQERRAERIESKDRREGTGRTDGTGRAGDSRAAELLHYIDSHWDEELTLSSLAQEMHFSVSYLSRFFQKATGTGFAAYLRKVRMIHARHRLAQGERSITQIAYDCGFRSPSVFIEAFKQEYDITPGQFRQKLLEEETAQAGTKQMRDQRKDFSALLAYLPEKETDEISLRQETWEIDCREGRVYGTAFGQGRDVDESETGAGKRPAEDGGATGAGAGTVSGRLAKDGGTAGGVAGHSFSRRDRTKTSDESAGIREASGQLWERMLNIGYAKDGLLAEVQDQVRRAQEEIGFTWFRCHGLLDEDMHIYGEDSEGVPFFSFAYMDKLFDFVTGTGLRPYVELSFMPPQIARKQNRIFDRPSIISGCSNLEKWKALILAVLEHLAQRYGHEALRTWRFATISLSYVRIGCLSRDDFAQLYEITYRTVKEFDPQISFGGAGYFPDLTEDKEIGVPWFLAFAADRGCLPDFHSMQWYPCIRTEDSLFMEYTLSQRAMPAFLSRNPDYLREKLDELGSLYRQYQVEGRELFLEECNSTLWQRDLSGDTCFKAVWLAKNMTASAGRAVFGYWLLTDLIEERAHIRSLFHGGYGLFTHNGIPKAGYHALWMLAQLGQERIAEGDGWILTRKGPASLADEKADRPDNLQNPQSRQGLQNRKSWQSPQSQQGLQLLVYNYSHYSDINCFRYKRLETPDEAYSVFRPGEKMQLHFLLRGLTAGESMHTDQAGHGSNTGKDTKKTTCRITRTLLTRTSGSSFDLWLGLQAPPYPGPEETEYLRKHAQPHSRMEIKEISDSLSLEINLMPLEMELITIEP